MNNQVYTKEQLTQVVTDLVQLAIQAKKVINNGSFPKASMSDVLFLDEMVNEAIERYTKKKVIIE